MQREFNHYPPNETDIGLMLSPTEAGVSLVKHRAEPFHMKDAKIIYELKNKSLREEILSTRLNVKAIEYNSKEFIAQMHEKKR